MKKVLITGGNGQLGSAIQKILAQFPDINADLTDIDELDITSLNDLQQFVGGKNYHCIINCAAYTAVDKAESEPDKAMMINRNAVGNLVHISNQNNIMLIHVSTDYVFDGKNRNHGYLETDDVLPASSYGRSKAAGEQIIIEKAKHAYIVRTSWLYSEYGKNFVKTILKKAIQTGKLKVVSDQIGNPTYAEDLARVLLLINNTKQTSGVEIFHYANEGICSWYDFAKAIVEIAKINCIVNPVSSSEYQSAAPRPSFSVMDTSKIKKHLNIDIPFWKDSLEKCIYNLTNN